MLPMPPAQTVRRRDQISAKNAEIGAQDAVMRCRMLAPKSVNLAGSSMPNQPSTPAKAR
ncbi:hypothetical protein D3C72_2347340 [compost metagenome]